MRASSDPLDDNTSTKHKQLEIRCAQIRALKKTNAILHEVRERYVEGDRLSLYTKFLSLPVYCNVVMAIHTYHYIDPAESRSNSVVLYRSQ